MKQVGLRDLIDANLCGRRRVYDLGNLAVFETKTVELRCLTLAVSEQQLGDHPFDVNPPIDDDVVQKSGLSLFILAARQHPLLNPVGPEIILRETTSKRSDIGEILLVYCYLTQLSFPIVMHFRTIILINSVYVPVISLPFAGL